MFGVINYSFKNGKRACDTKRNFNQKKVSLDRFVGPRFRSVRGCKGCRSRRKKCDETHPACQACVKRNIPCVWRDPPTKNGTDPNGKKGLATLMDDRGSGESATMDCDGGSGESQEALDQEAFNQQAFELTQKAFNHTQASEKPAFPFEPQQTSEHIELSVDRPSPSELMRMSPLALTPEGVSSILPIAHDLMGSSPGAAAGLELQEISFTGPEPAGLSEAATGVLVSRTATPELIEISASHPSALELSPHSDSFKAVDEIAMLPYQLDFLDTLHLPQLELFLVPFLMDSKGAYFVKHFEYKVAGSLTLGPGTSNYFSKTFLKLANVDESIGHAIASWGAFYVHKSDHEDVQRHFQKAMAITTKRFPRGSEVSKLDYYTLLCFHLIVLGSFVCRGDVAQWWVCFIKCYEIIERFGGIEELCRGFHYSNDIKFIISNFFYHDVMSSQAFLGGPLVEMKRYRDLFENGFFDQHYGIDPLQGCLNPVYLLLGEELEVYAAMKTRQDRLDSLLEGEVDFEADQSITSEFDAIRSQYFEFCEGVVRDIEHKIATCEIDPIMLASASKEEADLHQQVFALFKQVSKLYWALYIKKISLKSSEVQHILMKVMDGIDKLVNTPMVVVLCLPLLLAGTASYSTHDKCKLEMLFHRIIETCPVQNVRRAWVIIQECWKRNPTGDKLLDWAQICHEKNWQLCVC